MARMGDAFAKRIAALSPREQTLVTGGAVILLVALVISVGVLPAWRSLQQGPARQQALNAQVARVAQLEAQAQALKSRPVWSGAEAATKLQASSAGLAAPGGAAGGAAAEPLQLSLSPQQANATLRALPADTLAAWLTAAREQAHAVPSEAKLTRAAGAEGADRWSGTLVMRLPP
jgi:general secretion pathway protein M